MTKENGKKENFWREIKSFFYKLIFIEEAYEDIDQKQTSRFYGYVEILKKSIIDKKNEVCFLTGESGAGKSEAWKRAVWVVHKETRNAWPKFWLFCAILSFFYILLAMVLLPNIDPEKLFSFPKSIRILLFVAYIFFAVLFPVSLSKQGKVFRRKNYAYTVANKGEDIKSLKERVVAVTVRSWKRDKALNLFNIFFREWCFPVVFLIVACLSFYVFESFLLKLIPDLKSFLENIQNALNFGWVSTIVSGIICTFIGALLTFWRMHQRDSLLRNSNICIDDAENLMALGSATVKAFLTDLQNRNCGITLIFNDMESKDVKAFLSALKIELGSPYVFQLPSKEVAYLAFEKEDKAAYGALFEVLEETLVKKQVELFTIAKRSCEALKRWHELVVAVAWEETVSEKALWEKLTPLTIDVLISLKEDGEFKMTANEEDRPLEQCCCANIDDQAYLLNFPDGKKALRAAAICLK